MQNSLNFHVKKEYKLLCVDDNANNLFTLTALLQREANIEVLTALNGQKALKILLKEEVDLILLDVQMPEINGFELAKLIKSNKKTKDIPIIFVTAVFKSEEFVQEGFSLGAVDYITKPIDDNQLMNKITLYLKVFQQKEIVVESERRFYHMAQTSGDGIFFLDREFHTKFINNRALTLLGYKEKNLINRSIHQFIRYKDEKDTQILLKDCLIYKSLLEKRSYSNDSFSFVKKDGSFLPVSIEVTPLLLDDVLDGAIVIFKDLTEQKKIKTLQHQIIKNQEQIIHSMVEMIEARDSYTAGHTRRVAHYCTLIAKEMHYSDAEIEQLKNAAWLHDIGKISTPDNILLKPAKLNELEYELIQDHLTMGYEILSKIDQYRDIAEIMRNHHEKYDGSGYPRGLQTTQIPPLSRIMILADAFDAMTTNRVYKKKKSIEEALQEIQSLSKKHFHPEVVTVALRVLQNVTIDTSVSQLPKTAVEEQRFSYFYRDKLTDLFVIEYLPMLLRYHLNYNTLYLYKVQLHNFTQYNREHSWIRGNQFLKDFALLLRSLTHDAYLFRVEGDDFLILKEESTESLESRINTDPLLQKSNLHCSVIEEYFENAKESIEKIIQNLT